MKIEKVECYRDGGTRVYTTENGIKYAVDNRLLSETKGQIYLGYPKKDNSNLINEGLQEEIKEAIADALDNYGLYTK